MRYLLELLWLFVPRETPEGNPNVVANNDDGGSQPDSGADESVSAGKAAAPIGGSDPAGKPSWLPEKFWNADLGQPRAEIMAKSFTELEGKFRQKTDALKDEIRREMIAAAPEEYAVNLREDLEIPDNIQLDFGKDDPLVSWFFGFAKENGMSQEMVDRALNEYVSIELKSLPDVEAEIAKLGDHGQDRLMRVHSWMESRLSKDQLASMSGLMSTAEQVEALEALMKSSGPANFDGDTADAPLSLDELRAMQNDKRYWQDKDPAFIKKVEQGYQRLYKNQ